MFLKEEKSGDLIEVLSISDLIDPLRNSIPGRFHAGEEMGEPKSFFKTALVFPSNEALPRCWVDPNYKQGA
ncbi:acetyltransferase [Thiolapillus sp.]